MRLLLYHPIWAARSCEDCERFMYSEAGELVRRPARIGLPVLRPPGVPTPCWKCPKIPADAPTKTRQHAVELSDQNWQAWRHYRECKATHDFPRDPIVRRFAALILTIEEGYDRWYLGSKVDDLGVLLLLGRGRGG